MPGFTVLLGISSAIALGASHSVVLLMRAREGLVLTGIGLPVGLAATSAMSTVLQSLLVGVSAHNELTYSSVTVILGLIAALAEILPARRAARIDPVEALRNERRPFQDRLVL